MWMIGGREKGEAHGNRATHSQNHCTAVHVKKKIYNHEKGILNIEAYHNPL
jgi:hypothetical protein